MAYGPGERRALIWKQRSATERRALDYRASSALEGPPHHDDRPPSTTEGDPTSRVLSLHHATVFGRCPTRAAPARANVPRSNPRGSLVLNHRIATNPPWRLRLRPRHAASRLCGARTAEQILACGGLLGHWRYPSSRPLACAAPRPGLASVTGPPADRQALLVSFTRRGCQRAGPLA